VAGSVLVSAVTGFGLDTLRAEIAALLASLWEEVDVAVPYAAGELLARVRERGTVELEYGDRSVRVHGRMAPSMAGELRSVADRWAQTLAEEGVAT
jgi:GTP-binding protein HflX